MVDFLLRAFDIPTLFADVIFVKCKHILLTIVIRFLVTGCYFSFLTTDLSISSANNSILVIKTELKFHLIVYSISYLRNEFFILYIKYVFIYLIRRK